MAENLAALVPQTGKELKKTSTYVTLLSTTELFLRRIRLHMLQCVGSVRLLWNA
jgi:hypothetical protein